MPDATQQQLAFAGVDAVTAPHLVAQTKAISAVNIDFDAEPGAAYVRRGSVVFGTAGTGPVNSIFRHYNSPIAGQSPYYVLSGPEVYRGVSGVYTLIQSGATTTVWQPNSYHTQAYIPNVNIKDDGTTVTDWVKQSPSSAPTITPQSLNPLVLTTSTLTRTVTPPFSGGTNTYTMSTPYATVEGDLYSDGVTVFWAPDANTHRITVTAIPISTNMDLNGTHTIGNYGVDCLNIRLSDPTAVVKISRDYSIGDTLFQNYWHTEMPVAGALGVDPDSAQLNFQDLAYADLASLSTNTNAASLTLQQIQAIGQASQIRTPVTQISASPNSFNLWAIPRTAFTLISNSPVPLGWTNIQAMRIIVECNDSSFIVMEPDNWIVIGASDYPKTDAINGYNYWQTWATLDSTGAILGESAPSPPSSALKLQNGRIVVVTTDTATGTQHGITHSIIYANGGFLNDAYAVGSFAGMNGTFTDSLSDIATLNVGRIMNRNVLTRAQFPTNTFYVSEPFKSRLFVMAGNRLRWSLPGAPDTFPYLSYADVSHAGDEGKGLVVWPPGLIIINRDSVYEMRGNFFEGNSQDWSLDRMGPRHGSKAPKTVIKTPYGIPLLDYDGLYIYIPGQGVDQKVEWVQEQLGDAWRGNGAFDPASLKGNRIPALNKAAIDASVACFADDKLYLGLPCGDSTLPNVVFVLNFRSKTCQWYTYPFLITSLFWDQEDNRILAGTLNGSIMQIEQNTLDVTALGTSTSIPWNITTRFWSTQNDSILEDAAIDVETPGGVVVVKASYDSNPLTVLGTIENSPRNWVSLSQNETITRNVAYQVSGTHTSSSNLTAVHQLRFNALADPPRQAFVDVASQTYPATQYVKTWNVDMNPLGTVVGQLLLDDVPVLTHTFTGQERQAFTVGVDLDVEGRFRTAKKIEANYSSQGLYNPAFKHYETTYEVETKPFSKQTWAVTYKKSGGATQLDMARFWSLDAECPTGTATLTAIWDIDGIAFTTNTLTLVGRKWQDRLPFPPGGRGYLFQMRLQSDVDVEVYKSNLDIEMVGVKGFSRRTYAGTPTNG